MSAKRTTQPYRKSDSRGPSPVLDAMLAGRAAGLSGAVTKAAFVATRGAARKPVRVPRVLPAHKRHP